jgi:lipopolysaccharide transport system ATP-binding protein
MAGIIGPNGSGKSTLLRLIGGVGRPDEGSISVKGKIGALFDLGAGFHQNLSGRDNIYISGVVAGLTRRQISRRFDEIVSFSELEHFLDNPLRTYSSGMKMRLAFAVAANIDPEILLIDEVLSVGDLSFQSRCLERIQQIKQRGCTVLLVSHDIDQVKRFCDSVIWIKEGLLKRHGSPPEVIQAYAEEMLHETIKRTPLRSLEEAENNGTFLKLKENRFGSLDVEIVGIRLFGSGGTQVDEIHIGDPLRIEIDFKSNVPTVDTIFGVTITRPDGEICCEITSENNRLRLTGSRRQGTMVLGISRMDLIGGDYFIDVGIYQKDWEYAFDYHWHVYPLRMLPDASNKGLFIPPYNWYWKDRTAEGLKNC